MQDLIVRLSHALRAAALVAAMTLDRPGAGWADPMPQVAGTIELRLRGVVVNPEVDSTISLIGGRAEASTSFIPEIDGTYFFTPNLAAELIAGVTQHDVKARGTAIGDVSLGSVWLLPPTLTLQYHYRAMPTLDLYAGAGINYTFFLGPSLPSGGPVTSIAYDNNIGGAIQAGLDYAISDRWVLNLDVKQLLLNTTVHVNGAIKADVDLNPALVGVGVGYRF
ncbi:MAG TPA: OmpW family outer membrane protein [Stellaceae bacterium]|nr:OmpW family outer membrane protein [Stellaceae bacterium]